MLKKFFIDICKGADLYNSLQKYNKDIVEVCEEFKFVSDRKYNIEKKEASWWFDPRCVDDLPLSHVYPNCLPVQRDPRLNLILYAPNYLSLFLINTLYEDKKEILIEEQAGGMGRLIFYLSKLGFKNFNFLDNFTQLPKELFEKLMKKGNIKYRLNDFKCEPQIINLVGYTHFIKPIFKKTELVIIYNNVDLIFENEKGQLFYRRDDLKSVFPLENKVCLAIEPHGLARAYCNKDKVEEFRKKLLKYRSN